jgi:hypothetical protein
MPAWLSHERRLPQPRTRVPLPAALELSVPTISCIGQLLVRSCRLDLPASVDAVVPTCRPICMQETSSRLLLPVVPGGLVALQAGPLAGVQAGIRPSAQGGPQLRVALG